MNNWAQSEIAERLEEAVNVFSMQLDIAGSWLTDSRIMLDVKYCDKLERMTFRDSQYCNATSEHADVEVLENDLAPSYVTIVDDKRSENGSSLGF